MLSNLPFPTLIVSVSMIAVKRIPKWLITLIILIGLWVVFLWDAFGADRSFAIWMDNEFFMGPVLSSMSNSLRNGEWPLRMGTILGGIPLYNFSQISPFYPFYFVFLPIFNDPYAIMHSMHWITLFHLLIMEINVYLFLRVIGSSRSSAIFGAGLVAYSANSFGYSVWFNIISPYAWFPLYLAGLMGILMYDRSKRYSIMAVAGIVLLTLASPAQPLIHAVLVTFIFVFAYVANNLRIGKLKEVPDKLIQIGTVAIIAILITAPVILPVFLDFKDMNRMLGEYGNAVGNARMPFKAFLVDQLSITDLCGVFFRFKAIAVGHQLAGVIAIALACIAVVSRLRSWIVIAIAFIIVYSIISSTGSNLGLAYLNYYIPILNKIREPSRFLVLFQFGIGVLAALGIDDLRKAILCTDNKKIKIRQFITLLMVLSISVIVIFFARTQIVSNLAPLVTIVVLIMLIILTLLAYNKRLNIHNTIIAIIWGGSSLVLLKLEVPWNPYPLGGSQYLTSGTFALDKAIERVAKLDSTKEYRVVFDGKIDKLQAPMLASYRNVRTLNSYFNPFPRQQMEELWYGGPRGDNYFQILGAKYLICKECPEESTRGYKYSETVAGYDLFVTDNVLPHYYIAHQSNGDFYGLGDFTSKAARFDLHKGILFTQPNVNTGLAANTDSSTVDTCYSREEYRSNNRSRYTVMSNFPGVFVLNEFYSKTWKATVDGVKVESLKVNGNQIGVPFSSGSHFIEFRYSPMTFYLSFILMLLGIFALIIYLRVFKWHKTI